jgi:preprotein translocase SecE subunit
MAQEGAAVQASWFVRAARWIADVRAEMLKVTWEPLDRVRQATLVIVAFVAFIGAVIGIMDAILQALLVTGIARVFGG